MNKLQIIDAPLDFGPENLGVDLGPGAIRHTHLVTILKKLKFTILDKGSIKVDKPKQVGNPKLKYLAENLTFNKKLSSAILEDLKKKYYPIVLGGDHSITLGSVSAIARVKKNVGLIWIDAHPDCNTDKTTLTGNIHGMPLAALLGEGNKKLVNFFTPKQKIKTENTVIIGVKDIDEAELRIMRKLKVKTYTVDDVEEKGIVTVTNETINTLMPNVSHLHISIDLDAIDSEFAPGVGMPNYGGLTYREISYLTRKIGELKLTKSIDIVELNPTKDIENKTANLAVELIVNLLGKKYTLYETYLERNKL